MLRHRAFLPLTRCGWRSNWLKESVVKILSCTCCTAFLSLGKQNRTKHMVWLQIILLLYLIYVNSKETKKMAITMPKQGLEFKTLNFKALIFFPLSPLWIPLNFWDIRVVSKQAWCLNERFTFLAFILVVSQLLLRKRFLWQASLFPDVGFCSTFLEGIYQWLTFRRWVSMRWLELSFQSIRLLWC